MSDTLYVMLTYTSQIPVFMLIIVGYKIYRHGFRISQWGPERSNDLSNAIRAASDVRKGRLEFPDSGFTKENRRKFLNWAWAWIK
jgi:yeast amino acid transporter